MFTLHKFWCDDQRDIRLTQETAIDQAARVVRRKKRVGIVDE